MHGGTHLPPTTAPKSKRCAAGRAFLLHSPPFFVINLHHTALPSLELTLPFQFVLDEANITTAAKLCCRHERGANFSSCSARLVAFETIFSKRYLSGWIFFSFSPLCLLLSIFSLSIPLVQMTKMTF